MTRDTVLAMYPPAGTDHPDELFGHVRVVKTHDSYSVVEPCEFGESANPEFVPLGYRCEIVHFDFGDMRLRVALGADGEQDLGTDETGKWVEVLRSIGEKSGSVVEFVDDANQTQWLLRPTATS